MVHFIPIRMVHFNPIRVAHFIPLKVVHLFPIQVAHLFRYYHLKKLGGALCEHLSLHDGIISQGYKVYITQVIEVVYLHKNSTFLRRFNNCYNVLLAKLYRLLYF